MSSKNWRKNHSVIQQLSDAPHNFSFFQTVRLLERAAVLKNIESESNALETQCAVNPVASFMPPNSEVLRFHSHNALIFSNSPIEKIKHIKNHGNLFQWKMQVNFMGINGTNSVLPYHYTELILRRLKEKDNSLLNFFDVFNHRLISLFYQAGSKYFLPIAYERQKLQPNKNNMPDLSLIHI